MDKPKVLSGHDLVAKGVTKIDATLPEIGLKDVTPNGSWLEQKQVQAALEARKHLVEVERIEKLGTVSHATWWDDLKLAEVTQKAGGHWQYLGHNVGKTLYLRPEEALYLMEVNCLLLKHGGVTISLQKAYSLLLTEPTSLMRYRVYASLSRIGYKVFRHKIPEITKEKTVYSHKSNAHDKCENIEPLRIDTTMVENYTEQPLTDSSVEIVESNINQNISTDNPNYTLPTTETMDTTEVSNVCKKETNKDESTKETKNNESTDETKINEPTEKTNKKESSKEKNSETAVQGCTLTHENDSLSDVTVDEKETTINKIIKNMPIHAIISGENYKSDKDINGEENAGHSNIVETKYNEIQKDGIQFIDTKGDEIQHTETKVDEIQHTETKFDEIQHTETKGVEIQHIETKGDEIQHIETKCDEIQHIENKGDEIQRTETKGDEIQHTETKGVEIQQVETKGDEIQHIETKGDEILHIETKGVEIQHIDTKGGEIQHIESKADEIQNNATKDTETQNFETKDNKATLNTEILNADTQIITSNCKDEVVMDVDDTTEIKTQEETHESDTSTPNVVNISVETSQDDVTELANSTDINTSILDINSEKNEIIHINDENVDKSECMEISTDFEAIPDSTVNSVREDDKNRNVQSALAIEVDSADSDIVMDLDTPKSLDFVNDKTPDDINTSSKTDRMLSEALISKRNQIFNSYVTKLKKLTSRQFKPSNFQTLDKNFENIPDLFKKEVVTINVPDPQHIPKNIFVNNSSYVLDMKQIKRKSIRSVSLDSSAYNSSDEANGSHVRRIRSISNSEYTQNLQFVNRYPPRQTLFFRPYSFWRPQSNYVQFNMFVQRPLCPNMYYHSRFQYHRPNPLLRSFSYPNHIHFNPNNPNVNNNSRKRQRSAKATHLQSIKNLAVRLKQLVMGGNPHHMQNIESLHRLLYAYNTRYKARLRLTKSFEVVDQENIVETIDLEDDEESTRKRRRLSKDGDMFDENLNLLKQLALKLKELEAEEKSFAKHRRAMSKAIKTFNKSYDADVYLNSNFEVINKRLINIESDSESDCVVSEPKKVHKKKKLRNPFNILKRLSQQQAEGNPSTSNDHADTPNVEFIDETNYSEHISKTFNENWLPREDDFGRAEVVTKNLMNSHFVDAMKEEFMHNFIKDHIEEFNNWLDAKIAYLQHMEETDIAYQNEQEQMLAARETVNNSRFKPLVEAEECLDMPSVLEKLSIIKNNKEIDTKSNLSIHFDVYNRDVQNYRKTNPPKPHFRIICLEESSRFPTAAEVMALHSKYEDNVIIVFAIVGISAVSYLQINPIDLPVYVARNDLD